VGQYVANTSSRFRPYHRHLQIRVPYHIASNVGAGLNFYRQDVVTGSVHVYATVATTSDLSNHPIDFNQPASSDFAIVATLPTANVPPLLFGGANISGTIPLLPGGTPAIGVIIGLVISVVNGDVQLIPGEYGEISLGPPDATTYADWGKIEYRQDQPSGWMPSRRCLTPSVGPLWSSNIGDFSLVSSRSSR
jgi:hypothetical protein